MKISDWCWSFFRTVNKGKSINDQARPNMYSPEQALWIAEALAFYIYDVPEKVWICLENKKISNKENPFGWMYVMKKVRKENFPSLGCIDTDRMCRKMTTWFRVNEDGSEPYTRILLTLLFQKMAPLVNKTSNFRVGNLNEMDLLLFNGELEVSQAMLAQFPCSSLQINLLDEFYEREEERSISSIISNTSSNIFLKKELRIKTGVNKVGKFVENFTVPTPASLLDQTVKERNMEPGTSTSRTREWIENQKQNPSETPSDSPTYCEKLIETQKFDKCLERITNESDISVGEASDEQAINENQSQEQHPSTSKDAVKSDKCSKEREEDIMGFKNTQDKEDASVISEDNVCETVNETKSKAASVICENNHYERESESNSKKSRKELDFEAMPPPKIPRRSISSASEMMKNVNECKRRIPMQDRRDLLKEKLRVANESLSKYCTTKKEESSLEDELLKKKVESVQLEEKLETIVSGIDTDVACITIGRLVAEKYEELEGNLPGGLPMYTELVMKFADRLNNFLVDGEIRKIDDLQIDIVTKSEDEI